MTTPVEWRPNLPRDAKCRLCGSSKALVVDHCHEHGWVRGTACSGCNVLMGVIDRGLIPSTAWARLGSAQPLFDHRLRCHECTPRTFAEWDGKYVSANLTPDAAARLRALTAAMTIERGKRVTTSELVVALADLAEKHKDELIAGIKGES